MNNGINRTNKDSAVYNENYSLNRQQVFPIRIPMPPGSPPPGRPGRPGLFGRPEMPPPTTPPPNVSPQLPIGLVLPRQGTSNFNILYGNPARRRDTIRQFRRCQNRFTFVWLWDGSTFWFYPIFIGWQMAEGFIWNRGRWNFETINLNSIFFFNCF